MTVESAFLASVASYLSGLTLSPAPKSVGAVEPAASSELPAVVLSLEESSRPRIGLGDTGSVITGALPWTARIDLNNPRLPEDPSFSLVSPDRLRLTLPHGGLVRSDGSEGALGPADLTVTVKGTPYTVVSGTPGANQVSADPAVGVLTFADPLDTSGLVVVTYFLGQWERRVERLNGVLRVDTCTGAGLDAVQLSDAVVEALLGPGARGAVARLISIQLRSLGSVGVPGEAPPQARRRTALLGFEFERDVDRPESSGGVIREIPVTANVGVPDGG
ncbi:hypothetical protein JY651_14535 [Pyxidicoccus parkwayensis]|uniref:Uncharacterized protein n=1 Tax=Pyxidicoccus parkwayensis TaxID=2813578 RepID=A0ABX7P6E9_9BACT|nr:hypothetical protein [Pyxidicoccus parkwaysis]QSQ26062.1 hypothetical protein JY651_14535 [Pyxidicoccus parkwaysis]